MKKQFCINCEKLVPNPIPCMIQNHFLTDNYEVNGESITVIDHNEKIKLAELDAKLEGQKRVFRCKILAVMEYETYNAQEVWVCPDCKYDHVCIADEFRDIAVPKECRGCHEAKPILDKTQTITANIRRVLLQELPEESDDMNLRVVEAVTLGQDVFKVKPGNTKIVEVVFRSVRKSKYDKHNKIVLDIIRMRDAEEQKPIMPSEMEIEFLKTIPFENKIKSYAPNIWGMDVAKLSHMVGLVGGAKRGVMRSLIHILLIGDPGTAKSQLLNYAVTMIPKSAKASGRMATAAGLVAGIDERDGNRFASIGLVGMCNGGLVGLDEMDKMHPENRSGLHDVMEDRTIHLDKIGVNMTIPAETIIFGAANPKRSRYDVEASIKDNINMPDSLLDRFALIVCCLNNLPRSLEEQKSKHIARIARLCEEFGGSVEGMNEYCRQEGLLNHDMMRKYINYARTIEPKLPAEMEEQLIKLYLDIKYVKQEEGALSINTRTQEDFFRVAVALAKLDLSEVVTEDHVKLTWELFRKSLESFNMKTMGEMENAKLMDRHMNKDEAILDALKSCVKEDGTLDYNEAIISLQKLTKWIKSFDQAEKMFEKYREGKLLLVCHPKYKWHD